jgi:hypothetical protein
MSDRFARQRLLAAVGDLGQQRIAAATYVVSGDAEPSALVEREYLVRAGAERLLERETPARFTHATVFRHAAARDFAKGAWCALTQLRNALEQG